MQKRTLLCLETTSLQALTPNGWGCQAVEQLRGARIFLQASTEYPSGDPGHVPKYQGDPGTVMDLNLPLTSGVDQQNESDICLVPDTIMIKPSHQSKVDAGIAPPTAATPAAVRLGAVSYLNSRPLIENLDVLLPGSSIGLDYPSKLADSLRQKELDVALIPSIEYFRRPGYEIISNACVAARGAVMSVKLYCRVHPGEIRRMALDEGSRTSATLSRVILAEKYGAFPASEPLSMESMTTDSTADAVLLIGDRAMHTPKESFVEVMDLGQMWYDWTGLPFVFAMWVAHQTADTRGVAEALNEARDRGVQRIRSIAAAEAPGIGITENAALDYLTQNLHYQMTSAEKSGLQLFHALASQHHLVDQNANLVFSDFVTA